MNPIPHNPQPFKLRWVPMEPSWILSIGLIILAVLPHQIPAVGRETLQSWVGGVAFAGLSCWVFTQSPVLGSAMILLLVGILADGWRTSRGLEGFHSTVTTSSLQKDRVIHKKHRWFEEEVLMEEPSVIQEKTEDPGLLFDRVTSSDRSGQWLDEEQLGEHPIAIQDRPVWSFGESEY